MLAHQGGKLLFCLVAEKEMPINICVMLAMNARKTCGAGSEATLKISINRFYSSSPVTFIYRQLRRVAGVTS
jgi:hypothetical protein